VAAAVSERYQVTGWRKSASGGAAAKTSSAAVSAAADGSDAEGTAEG
jgi:hypothetical protein